MNPRRDFVLPLRLLAASLAGLALCECGVPPATSGAALNGPTNGTPSSASRDFKFRTIVDRADRTFNEALGINDSRTVAGYYGSGATDHSSQGYTTVPPFAQKDFTAENYPGALQTEVTSINGSGDTAGVWTDNSGAVRGFIDWNGVFTSYNDPNAAGATEILGLNDSGIAVGVFVDSYGHLHGFTLNQATGTFQTIDITGATNTTVTGINDNGDIVGYSSSRSQNVGFLESSGNFTPVSYPGAVSTMALGINAHDSVVGGYLDGSGKTHGFLLQNPLNDPQWTSIDDPQGVGTTMLNGINDRLNMVGYYVDSGGNTIGVLVERKKM